MHGLGLTLDLVALLDQRFRMIIYLCLVALNKQQINWEEVTESFGKLGNRQLQASDDLSKIECNLPFLWQEKKMNKNKL